MQIMIRDIVAKWPGATHATHIWNNCKLAKAFEDGTIKCAWLLGDRGYAHDKRDAKQQSTTIKNVHE